MADRPGIAETCSKRFTACFGTRATLTAWAPGRVCLLGEHTDYNGGLSLAAAIDRWVCVALRPRPDRVVRVHSANFDGEYQGELDALPPPAASWERFVVGALEVFGSRRPLARGFDALITGDVPHGAGLSSSAALTMAWLNALWVLDDPHPASAGPDDLALVHLGQRVEHEYLGVPCGLLDQMASQLSVPGHVLRIDFRDVTWAHVPMALEDVAWVVVHSGVRRELAHSGYDDRVAECARGFEALRELDPSLDPRREGRLSHLVGEEVWRRRLRHVFSENERVRRATECMEAGDPSDFGELMLQTHASLRDDYEVSCPELDALVEIAGGDPDCWGARMVGGGFGGCTLNLVRAAAAETFISRVGQAYSATTGR